MDKNARVCASNQNTLGQLSGNPRPFNDRVVHQSKPRESFVKQGKHQ